MRKFFLWAVLIMTAGLRADGISVTLDNANQTGSAGQMLSFYGIITNDTSSIVYLTSASEDFLSIPGSDANDLTITDDLANAPLSLLPGASTGDIDLFDVSIAGSLTDPFGLYSGVYDLTGGPDSGDQTDLTPNGIAFSINLENQQQSSGTVPEPSTTLVVGAALLSLRRLIARHHRH